MTEWLWVVPTLVSVAAQCFVLAVAGVVLSLRIGPMYVSYVVVAGLQLLITITRIGLSAYVVDALRTSPTVPTTPLYVLSGVGWLDSTVSPAILLAVVAGPVVWQLSCAQPSEPVTADPQ